MKGLAAAALVLAVALPVAAQRGGGHAGFSGHSAPAVRSAPSFYGGVTPSRSFQWNGVPLLHPPAGYPPSMRNPAAPVRYPGTAPTHRPGFYQPDYGGRTDRAHHIVRRYPYLNYGSSVVFLPYSGPLEDSSDDFNASQQPPQQPDDSNNYPPDYYPPNSGYPYPQAPQPMPAYPPPAPATPEMQYVPGSAETVTLIFKDGRPPEQIQNYLATRTTLTILDNSRRREVALSDLDLPATMKANRETGVDFELPAAVR